MRLSIAHHPRARSAWGVGAVALWCVVAVLAGPAAPLAAVSAGAGLTDLSGGELGGESLDQGTVLVVVYASWSPRCRGVISKVEAMEKKWGAEARVLLVSFQETAEEVEAFVGKDAGVEIAIDRDGSFSKRHAVTYLPGLLVLREGKTVFSGKLPPRGADQLLNQILS